MIPIIHKILNDTLSAHKLPILRIIETGCISTLDIVSWIDETLAEINFTTVDLDGTKQADNHKILESNNQASLYTFLTQDHKKYLNEIKWVDIAFLAPDDLQGGLEEFQLAASAGTANIVIKDYQTKAALAVKQAKRFGWNVYYNGDYTVINRPRL